MAFPCVRGHDTFRLCCDVMGLLSPPGQATLQVTSGEEGGNSTRQKPGSEAKPSELKNLLGSMMAGLESRLGRMMDDKLSNFASRIESKVSSLSLRVEKMEDRIDELEKSRRSPSPKTRSTSPMIYRKLPREVS
ncbi:hypothetical protein PoB_000098000 [Plakobranchus ocellatus]|uniref:Uncharacterized protein n=1 Tax=Plakobranchus ocellatus TaxID=259542 RepID=A0AAV3XV12_9GAST|nr:hypothetical protein PoB_000098000 [Plakobranchus ocellatus]